VRLRLGDLLRQEGGRRRFPLQDYFAVSEILDIPLGRRKLLYRCDLVPGTGSPRPARRGAVTGYI